MVNYYEILGVENTASAAEIKKKYKDLVTKWHPDKHTKQKGSKEFAESKYKEIMAAYEVLSDPNKREVYDLNGDNSDDESGSAISSPDFHFSPDADCFEIDSNIDQEYLQELLNNIHKSVEENEKVMKERRKEMGRNSDSDSDDPMMQFNKTIKDKLKGCDFIEKTPRKGANIEYELKMSLEEMYKGCCKQIRVIKRVRERKEKERSSGKKYAEYDAPQIANIFESVNVEVQPLTKPGDDIYMKGLGHHSDEKGNITKEPGDMIIRLVEDPHQYFRRDGYNLNMTMEITYNESINGFTRKVKGINGREFNVKIDRLLLSTDFHVVKGKGLWISGDLFGDLVIKFVIDLEEVKDSKLDSKLDGKLDSKLNGKLNCKLASKLDSKLNCKLDSKLDSKTGKKDVADKIDKDVEKKPTKKPTKKNNEKNTKPKSSIKSKVKKEQ